ncbi:hypothetical protein [Novosphingobium lentum]|uniref:hypothetical protein n=1 Tax=Novosphingobium lentum TaxID=145287 RepID=UPI00082C4C4A|nr:hypothetical protein [Novosphingobium lentum]
MGRNGDREEQQSTTPYRTPSKPGLKFVAGKPASNPTPAPLAEPAQFSDLVRYATLAPAGHNTLPRRFRLDEKRIEILPDFMRRPPVIDLSGL